MPQREEQTDYEAFVFCYDADDSAGLGKLTRGAPVSIEIGDDESTKLKLTGKVAFNCRSEDVKDRFAIVFRIQAQRAC